MQFKYPELLWALFLLLIPIIIHLFQLRRFKKTAFTNVKVLQKVVSESRKSSTLKKWLLLFTRLSLFAALILAFAQPFFAKESALAEKETVIYLDDSFSMQAKSGNSSLLNIAVQEIIKVIPKDRVFHLFTNDKVFRNSTIKEIQNDLLALPYTSKQLTSDEIILKAKTFFGPKENTLKNLILISDFQQRMEPQKVDSTSSIINYRAQLAPDTAENIAIDTAYIEYLGPEEMELTTMLSSNSNIESIPVSLYNGVKLIAKTSATFNANGKSEIMFSLPSDEVIDGKIEISDTGLSYDNQLFFTINQKEKIKVLAINGENGDYLNKIFTDDEFQYTATALQDLNYSLLDAQNLIVLNEIPNIPNALQNALRAFTDNGGSLIIVPSLTSDIINYNQFLGYFSTSSFTQRIQVKRNISNIAFSHPLFRNVFEKEVKNFQYPRVNQYLRMRTRASTILSYEDNAPFLVGSNGVYIFSAPISNENSNFKNSPLIVPTFYTIGINSLKLPQPYQELGTPDRVDVSVTLEKDNILKLVSENYELIPQQQSFPNKVSLSFNENPVKDGIYGILNENVIIKNLGFNYTREESDLQYQKFQDNFTSNGPDAIASLFETMEGDHKIHALWKWFIILAIGCALIEILIQKVLK